MTLSTTQHTLDKPVQIMRGYTQNWCFMYMTWLDLIYIPTRSKTLKHYDAPAIGQKHQKSFVYYFQYKEKH